MMIVITFLVTRLGIWGGVAAKQANDGYCIFRVVGGGVGWRKGQRHNKKKSLRLMGNGGVRVDASGAIIQQKFG